MGHKEAEVAEVKPSQNLSLHGNSVKRKQTNQQLAYLPSYQRVLRSSEHSADGAMMLL